MWSVSIHGHGVEVTHEIATGTDRLLSSALRPLGDRVRAVSVRLRRSGEPDATSCHIRVDLVGGDGFALGDTGNDVMAAIARAAERLRAVAPRMRGLAFSLQATPAHSLLS